MDNPDDTPLLADLNVSTVRRENDAVDERISELESEADDLRGEVADLEAENDRLEKENDQARELLSRLQDSQRNEQLQRIKEANERVDPDQEIDLETLEDASVDHLATVADMLEVAADKADSGSISNTENRPDVGGTNPEEDDDLESALEEMAQDMGLTRPWEKAKNDSFSGPNGTVANANHNGASSAPTAGDIARELASMGDE